MSASTRAGKQTVIQRAAVIWSYRELLGNLIRKELKARYTNSILGFLWTFFNPAVYLIVFYVVFRFFLPGGIPNFAIFLLAGLLPWNLFSNSLASGATSITGNASLVQKVWFPREVLPLAAVGASTVHFFLQSVVLGIALVVFTAAPAWHYLPLLPVAVLVLALLAAAFSLIVSVMNVYMRDTQHFIEVALLPWFYITPIIYPFRLVADQSPVLYRLLLANPLAPIVLTFQRAIYGVTDNISSDGSVIHGILPDASPLWYLRNLLIVGAGAGLLVGVSLWIFGRVGENLAEEL